MVQAEAAAKSFSLSSSWTKWVHTHLLLLVMISAESVLGGQIVKSLPGYDGELPFKLETGYISVDDSELFYYFIESEGNPQEDPLFLWLTGGPGCTALSGLLYEVGPMEYDISNYTEGLPKLKYYPHARTKTASMIFLDAPVGTGFSYSRTPEGWSSSDTKSSEQSYNFLRKWLVEHPQFLSVHLFIGGDSHAGMIVPLITRMIIDGNKDKAEPYMNIKGYLVGCPTTDWFIDSNSYVQYAHAMALISDEIYENAKRSCKENYVDVDPANSACIAALGDIQKCIKDLNKKDILKPNCDVSSSDSNRRSLEDGASEFLLQPSIVPNPWCTNAERSCKENYVDVDPANSACIAALGDIQKCIKDLNKKDILKPNCDVSSSDSNRRSLEDGASEFLLQPSIVPNPWCTTFRLTHNKIWANDDSVQDALHVRKGTVQQWERCNYSLSYSRNVFSVVSVHIELSRSALEVLVESGDHDMTVPYVGTLKWIKSLNLTPVGDWRPWYVDHQVAGYTIKYSKDGYRLTFATVKGAGHPAPEYYRRECYHLFHKWVNLHPI